MSEIAFCLADMPDGGRILVAAVRWTPVGVHAAVTRADLPALGHDDAPEGLRGELVDRSGVRHPVGGRAAPRFDLTWPDGAALLVPRGVAEYDRFAERCRGARLELSLPAAVPTAP